MRRYAHAVDQNQPAIVDALRKCGVCVHDTSGVGDGFPDLVCGWKGKISLLELKVPGEELNEAQKLFHERWRARGLAVHVVESLDEAFDVLGVTTAASTRRPLLIGK